MSMGMPAALICHRWPGKSSHCHTQLAGCKQSQNLNGFSVRGSMPRPARCEQRLRIEASSVSTANGVLSHSSWAACTSQDVPADAHAPCKSEDPQQAGALATSQDVPANATHAPTSGSEGDDREVRDTGDERERAMDGKSGDGNGTDIADISQPRGALQTLGFPPLGVPNPHREVPPSWSCLPVHPFLPTWSCLSERACATSGHSGPAMKGSSRKLRSSRSSLSACAPRWPHACEAWAMLSRRAPIP